MRVRWERFLREKASWSGGIEAELIFDEMENSVKNTIDGRESQVYLESRGVPAPLGGFMRWKGYGLKRGEGFVPGVGGANPGGRNLNTDAGELDSWAYKRV